MKKAFLKESALFLKIVLSIVKICATSSLVLFLTMPVLAQSLSMDTSMTDEMTPAVPEGPGISDVSVTDITDTSARIAINSDEVVQGYVEYGTTEQYGMSTPLSSEFSTSPSFLLENLMPETRYHYRVVAMDMAGNATITTDETFTTHVTPAPAPSGSTSESNSTNSDSTATSTPESNPTPALTVYDTETVAISTSTARITWRTNKNANGQIEYGTTNAYGTRTTLGVITTTHAVNISGLVPKTKYYYRALSKTDAGQSAVGVPQEFTTLALASAPVTLAISNVAIDQLATSSATISWTTSKLATSDILYGTTTSYGATVGKDQNLTTAHRRTLLNLTPTTRYHFQISVVDSEKNTVLSKDRTFSTTAVNTPSSLASEPLTTPPVESVPEPKTPFVVSYVGSGLPVAPSPPMLLKVEQLDGQAIFLWQKDRGVKNGVIHTVVVRKEGSDYVRSRVDGKIVYDGPATTFTDTGLTNGTEYHYGLYSYGAYDRLTSAARVRVVPRADIDQINLSAEDVQTSTVASLNLSRDLFLGKRGEDVKQLQIFLIKHGYYPEALATGYFGPLTRSAVIRFQKLSGVVPSIGYVGPITRTVLGQ